MSEIVEHYRERGYCLARQLLPPGLVQAVRDDVHELFRLQLARFAPRPARTEGVHGLVADMAALLEADQDAYLGAARRAAKLASLHRLSLHDALLGVARALGVSLPTVATEPVMHIVSDQLRVRGGYFGFAPHQDWPSMQGSLDSVIAWIPLVDVGARSFPLQVIPGSHARGPLAGRVRDNEVEIDRSLYDDHDFVSATVDAGDVVFMSCWTVHRTGVDGCRGFRLAVSTRYENAAEPTFVERGYPSAYRRTIVREPITPDFPSPHQVASLFGGEPE